MFSTEDIRYNYGVVREQAGKAAADCGRKPEEVTVIAVSKTQPGEVIEQALEAGIRVFGENYVQELTEKHAYLDGKQTGQPEWHFIGHLQSNKVKYIAPFITMIHSVDSIKLAEVISEQAKRHGRIIDILLQVNTSGEESKFGCEPEELPSLAEAALKMDGVRVLGLMTIGSFSNDEEVVRREFVMLRGLLKDVNNSLGTNLSHLSMGMSGDYELAVTEGATMVRVGTSIFGARIYRK